MDRKLISDIESVLVAMEGFSLWKFFYDEILLIKSSLAIVSLTI